MIDKLVVVVVLIFMSLAMRVCFQAFGQRWITTTAHTSTLVLLPLVTYVITNVISGNIALSLGMVGALSIVRFRHPVRSPLELTAYFIAITMGIAASVSVNWLVFLAGSLLLAAVIIFCVNYLTERVAGQSFLTSSFSEGNSLSTLDIKFTANSAVLDKSKLLIVKQAEDGEITYTLATNNFEQLKDILSTFKDDARMLSYQLRR